LLIASAHHVWLIIIQLRRYVFTLLLGARAGSADLWRCGGVEVWRCGGVEVWRCGGVEVWRCGGVEVWRCAATVKRVWPLLDDA